MIFEFGNYFLDVPYWLIMTVSFVLAFAMTYVVIPSIITVSKEKHLFDTPSPRKSHLLSIPTLGGAAVFIGMMIPTTLFGSADFEHSLKYIIAGLLILFFIGMKDDILIISPKKKLLGELFAISIIVILGNIRVSTFHGFLGIDQLPYLASILFTVFMFVVIINGFNLIDGIDGLASGVGILSISSLGIWFIMLGMYSYATFCLSTVGALLAFFRFNVFGRANKIFLGDTGSLIIGLVVSVFTVTFLESTLTVPLGSVYKAAPAIAIGILIVPLIDTLRVFVLRIITGRSPFSADRYHIHHRLLRLELTHLQSTLILLGFNVFIIILSVLLRGLGNIKLLLITIPLSMILTSIPGFIIRYKERMYMRQLNILGRKTWMLPITVTNSILSRQDRNGQSMATDHNDQSKAQPVLRDLEPILEENKFKYAGHIDYIEPLELEEYPD